MNLETDFSRAPLLGGREDEKRTSLSWTARPKTRVERSNSVEQELNFERRMTRDADRHADQQSMSN